MSDDRELKIKITNEADLAGIEKEKKALGDVTDATKEAGKAGEEAAKKAGKAGTEAAKDTTREVEKEIVSHHTLHGAVQGLREEFPLLSHVFHLAMNPIALAVAGISAGFALFRERVNALLESFGRLELPQISEEEIGKVDQMAAAWERYAKAVRDAAEAAHSPDAQSAHRTSQIEKEAETQKKILAAQKEQDLATLEANKGDLTPGQYAAARASVESRYNDANAAAEHKARQAKLDEQVRHANELAIESNQKAAAAAAIKIASAETDAKNLADLKAQADAATKDQEERKKRIGEISDAQGEGTWERAKMVPTFGKRYGYTMTGDEAKALEQSNADSDQDVINRYHEAEKRKAARDAARQTRDDLEKAAAKDAAEATTIREGLPGAKADAQADDARAARVSAAQQGSDDAARAAHDNDLPGKSDIDRASAIARAEALHQKVTAADDAFLEAFEKNLTSQGKTADQVLTLLLTYASTARSQDDRLSALEKMSKDLQQRIQHQSSFTAP